MEKATFLNFEGRDGNNERDKFRDIMRDQLFYVKKFTDNCLFIEIENDMCGDVMAEVIVGCFAEDSNAKIIIAQYVLTQNIDILIEKICFEYKGTLITATNSTSVEDIIQQLYCAYNVMIKGMKV